MAGTRRTRHAERIGRPDRGYPLWPSGRLATNPQVHETGECLRSGTDVTFN
jgi:hypothetical protein